MIKSRPQPSTVIDGRGCSTPSAIRSGWESWTCSGAGTCRLDALASALEVPGNLLAHHLKVLEAAGVVTRSSSQNDRRRTYVHLVDSSLEGLRASAGHRSRRHAWCSSARTTPPGRCWPRRSGGPSATCPARRQARSRPLASTRGHARLPGGQGSSVQDEPGLGGSRTSCLPTMSSSRCATRSTRSSVHCRTGASTGPCLTRRGSTPTPPSRSAVADLSDRVTHLAPRIRYRRHAPTRKAPR